MTGLLVSVRSAEEAELAMDAGVDLIDVKEPRRGALGAADPETVSGVLDVVGRRLPVSAAMGELESANAERIARLPHGLNLAKFGLAGCAAMGDWQSRWDTAVRALRQGTSPVAVVYADWKAAQAPSPELVLETGGALGCGWLLVDTFAKNGAGLLEAWDRRELARFLDKARGRQMKIVLAGSLSARTIPEILKLEPDYIGVRGAVCSGDRTGTLDYQKMVDLSAATRAARQSRPTGSYRCS